MRRHQRSVLAKCSFLSLRRRACFKLVPSVLFSPPLSLPYPASAFVPCAWTLQTVRKAILSEMVHRQHGREHPEFKEVFSMVYKGVQFTFVSRVESVGPFVALAIEERARPCCLAPLLPSSSASSSSTSVVAFRPVITTFAQLPTNEHCTDCPNPFFFLFIPLPHPQTRYHAHKHAHLHLVLLLAPSTANPPCVYLHSDTPSSTTNSTRTF